MGVKKIGFFGGCFNPPSNVHIELAKKVQKEHKLDSVIFVLVGDFYEKAGLAKAKDRYNMLKIAIKGEKDLDIDDIELHINKKIYAVDIFKLIAEKYCNDDIYYIMGSDNFDKMPKWKDYDDIKDKYKYIVIEREDSEISSTKVRDMIRKSDSRVLEILDKEVYEYIRKYKLYE